MVLVLPHSTGGREGERERKRGEKGECIWPMHALGTLTTGGLGTFLIF